MLTRNEFLLIRTTTIDESLILLSLTPLGDIPLIFTPYEKNTSFKGTKYAAVGKNEDASFILRHLQWKKFPFADTWFFHVETTDNP